MIHTKCSDCCFFRSGQCSANQWMEEGEEAFARGYCHLKRTQAWQKQYPQLNEIALLALIKRELGLKFDLLVLFDENTFTYNDLDRTINTQGWKDEFCTKIMIADITGNEDRQENISKRFLENNTKENLVPLYVDQSIDRENSARTIDRLYKKFNSRYFLVLTAGQIVNNLTTLNRSLTTHVGRAVHWRFPIKINETYIDFIYPFVGLYHRIGFHLLHQRCTEDCLKSQPCKCSNFVYTLSKDSEQLEFNLSLLFNECVIS